MFVGMGTTATRSGLGGFASTLPSDIQDNDLIIAIPFTTYSVVSTHGGAHTGPASFTKDITGLLDIASNEYGNASCYRKKAVRADDAGTTYTWSVVDTGHSFAFQSALATFVYRGPNADTVMTNPSGVDTHGSNPVNMGAFANSVANRLGFYVTIDGTVTIADPNAVDMAQLTSSGITFGYFVTHITGNYPATSISDGTGFGCKLFSSPESDTDGSDHWGWAEEPTDSWYEID